MVNAAKKIVVAGCTGSSDFPTVGAFDRHLGGSFDGFVSKFTNDGRLVCSTYLGSDSDDDSAYSVIADKEDNILVAGSTDADDFPTMNAHNDTFGGIRDAFVCRFLDLGMGPTYDTDSSGGWWTSASSLSPVCLLFLLVCGRVYLPSCKRH